MKSSLGDKPRLKHIYDSITEIEGYVSNVSFEEFQSNLMMQRACTSLLVIIGEAANHLSDWFKKENKEIEWREIVDLRNILIHEYFGVDNKIVWDIIQQDLPELKSKVEEILKQI